MAQQPPTPKPTPDAAARADPDAGSRAESADAARFRPPRRMKLFGLEVKRAPTTTLTPATSRGGWWPIVREPYTGAWQKNDEILAPSALTNPVVFACVTLDRLRYRQGALAPRPAGRRRDLDRNREPGLLAGLAQAESRRDDPALLRVVDVLVNYSGATRMC